MRIYLRRLLVPAAALILAPSARAGTFDTYGAGTLVQRAATTVTASNCKTVKAWRGYKLLIGIMAWRYYAKVHWCWNGRRITAFLYGRWGETYVPTWDFVGHIGKSGYGGVGTRYARRWTQGKFKQCAQFCVQTRTPWVEIVVTRRGRAYWNAGG